MPLFKNKPKKKQKESCKSVSFTRFAADADIVILHSSLLGFFLSKRADLNVCKIENMPRGIEEILSWPQKIADILKRKERTTEQTFISCKHQWIQESSFVTHCLTASRKKRIADPLHGLINENVAKKMNLLPFKLHRVYLEPLNLSNVGRTFSCSSILKDFLQVQKEKRKFDVVYVHVLHRTSHRQVLRRLRRAMDVREG